MELLFDSADSLTHFTPAETSPINIIAGNITFAAGGSYYLVVYNSPDMPHSGSYSIMVGEPKRYHEKATYTIPQTSCIAGQAKAWQFTLTPWVGDSAYVDFVTYNLPGLDWKGPDNTCYWIKTPGKSTWDKAYIIKIDYQYESTSIPLRKANGVWTFQITPGKTGVLPAGDLSIWYYFDV